MRLSWNFLWFALLTATVLLGAGCGGISASQSVSPLDFLLPGAGHFLKVEPAPTNAPVVLAETSTEITAAR